MGSDGGRIFSPIYVFALLKKGNDGGLLDVFYLRERINDGEHVNSPCISCDNAISDKFGRASNDCGAFNVPIISAITPKPDKKLVDDAFKCYDEKITVPLSTSLNSEK